MITYASLELPLVITIKYHPGEPGMKYGWPEQPDTLLLCAGPIRQIEDNLG